MLFKRDCFTVISFNTLKMKRCGDKLITERHKYVVCKKHNKEEGGHIMSARNVM